ncbi:MAG: hypothetical protein ACJ73S_27860 [Mycobacteriales bacterium]
MFLIPLVSVLVAEFVRGRVTEIWTKVVRSRVRIEWLCCDAGGIVGIDAVSGGTIPGDPVLSIDRGSGGVIVEAVCSSAPQKARISLAATQASYAFRNACRRIASIAFGRACLRTACHWRCRSSAWRWSSAR